MFRESISLYEQIGQSDPEHRDTLASVLGDWAKYLHYLEDFEKAETARNRAIALHMQLIKDHPSVPGVSLQHGDSLPEPRLCLRAKATL